MKNEMMKKLTSAPQTFSSESLTLMIALKLALVVALLMGASTATLADEAFPETTESGEVIALVNINADDAEKMAELLDGVGVVRAEAIVEYREAMGGFSELEDLLAVSGIGPATLENNRHKLVLDDQAAAD